VYDGRTVGYISLCDWLRLGDTGRDVGVSPPDVSVCWFRALWLAVARTTVGPSATLRSVIGCPLWTQGGMWASVLLTWVCSGSGRSVFPRARRGNVGCIWFWRCPVAMWARLMRRPLGLLRDWLSVLNQDGERSRVADCGKRMSSAIATAPTPTKVPIPPLSPWHGNAKVGPSIASGRRQRNTSK